MCVHSRFDASNMFEGLLGFAASSLGSIQPCFSSASYGRAPFTHSMHEAFTSIVIRKKSRKLWGWMSLATITNQRK